MKNAFWLILLVAFFLAVFLPSYSRMQDLNTKNVKYRQQIENLKVKNRELREELILLEEDPEYFEKVAREKLGIVREGEVVYRMRSVHEAIQGDSQF